MSGLQALLSDKAKLMISTVAEGQRCFILENGMVVLRQGQGWYLRRFDPNEVIDSKWDVYNHEDRRFDAAACLAIADKPFRFGNAESAIEAAVGLGG